MQNIQLTAEARNSYKIGVDEIVGLKDSMIEVMRPVQKAIKDKIYWSEVRLQPVEYKSRDGLLAQLRRGKNF